MTRPYLSRGLVALCLLGTPVAMLPGVAEAFWTTTGLGSGSASTGTLGAPQGVTATASTNAATVRWDAPSGQAPDGYRVAFADGTQVCQVGATVRECSATGLAANTTYDFVVTSLLGSWTTSAAAVSVTTSQASDTVAPAVTITSAPPALSNNRTPALSGTYGQAAGDLASVSVQLYQNGAPVGATTTATINGDGTWSATLGPLADGSYAAQASQSDQAGNVGTATSGTFVVDGSALTATVDQAASQSDPTNGSPVRFSVVFNKPVTDFTASDLSLGGTAGGTRTATVTGSGQAYEVAVSGMTGTGTVTASLAAGVATDAAGNTNAASTSTDNSVLFDADAPNVASILRNTSATTNAASVSWTVTFSESVTGVDAADFALATSGVTGAGITGVTGSGTTWTVTAGTGTGNGTVGLNLVDNDSVVDGSGNKLGGTGAGNGSVTGPVYTIDKTAPTAVDIQLTNGGGTAGRIDSGDVITYTFSEEMAPGSLLGGWNGTEVAVTVLFDKGSGANNDKIKSVSGSSGGVNLNQVDLGVKDAYVKANNVSVTAKMTLIGSRVVIVLTHTPTASQAGTVTAATAAIWNPSATATDLAGNAMSTTARTETGTADVDF